MTCLPFRLAILSLAILVPPAVQAAPAPLGLASSTPAANGTASKVTRIDLNFTAPLKPGSLTVTLAMTAMAGMSHHGEMAVQGFRTTIAPDGRGATLILMRALPAGTYRLDWQASAEAATPASGSLTFSVR